MKPTQLAAALKLGVANDILFSRSPYSLVYACLTRINFRGLKSTNNSITQYSTKVLTAWLFRNTKEVKKPLLYFIGSVLQFKAMPYLYKEILEAEAKKDLLQVNELIRHYKSLDFINDYISNHSTPRNHIESTSLVFFKRAEAKLYSIINYIHSDLERIALEAAERVDINQFLTKKGVHHELELQSYYPYKDVILNQDIKCAIDFEKLDYRKINIFRNKMFVNGLGAKVDSGLSITELNDILIKIKPESYLNYIINSSKLIPIIGKRTEIFKELSYLFLKKKWYGFYALALPQVEGIFSDMLKIASPKKSTQGALPAKVGAVRSYHSLSDKFFDYYQYYLPNQRNRFAHTGNDEDIKVKSYHLLMDLWYIVRSFLDMNAPLLEVIRAIKKGRSYFEDIGYMARFIVIVSELASSKGLQDKEESIRTYLYDFLEKGIDIASFYAKLQNDFNKAFVDFDDKFGMSSYVWGKKEISFAKSSKGELYKSVDLLKKIVKGGSFLYEDTAKLLIDTNNFVRNITTVFQDVPPLIKQETDKFYRKNKEILDKIDLLGPGKKVPIEIGEDFMPYNRIQLTHKEALLH